MTIQKLISLKDEISYGSLIFLYVNPIKNKVDLTRAAYNVMKPYYHIINPYGNMVLWNRDASQYLRYAFKKIKSLNSSKVKLDDKMDFKGVTWEVYELLYFIIDFIEAHIPYRITKAIQVHFD